MQTNTFDVEAERCVLGGILISAAPLPPAIELLSPGDFAHQKHADVFSAILEVHGRNEPVDELTVYKALVRKDGEQKKGWASFLAELTSEIPTAANVEYHAKIVRSEARRRDFLAVMTDAVKRASKPGIDSDEVIDEAIRQLGHLAAGRELIRPATLREIIRDEYRAIGNRHEHGVPPGLPTGFVALDRLLGGLQPGGVTIVAARPSMGKSAFASGVLNYLQRMEKTGLLFTLEMTREEQAQRVFASEGRIDLNRIRRGNLNTDEFARLAETANRLNNERIGFVDTGGLSMAELRATSRQWAAQRGLDIIVVDYLQLLTGDGDNREQEVASISRGLKSLAKELRVPVIALSQLSRRVEERSDKRPMLSDLRESGSLEQDASQVIFIYRDDYYNPKSQEPGLAEIGVAKNRNGPTGMIKLRWTKEHTRFDSLDQDKQPELPNVA